MRTSFADSLYARIFLTMYDSYVDDTFTHQPVMLELTYKKKTI